VLVVAWDEGLRIDIIDDTRLVSWPPSCAVEVSVSAAEKERFRDGEMNDAGDSDGCRSSVVAMDARDARRLSSVRYRGASWCEVLAEW
jgi:hypothetical protein